MMAHLIMRDSTTGPRARSPAGTLPWRMPPITLWFTLAVCAGFGILFTAGAVLGLLDLRRPGPDADRQSGRMRGIALYAILAAFSWLAVYRVFRPM